MSHKGFSHIGLATLGLDKNRKFYDSVFRPRFIILHSRPGPRLLCGTGATSCAQRACRSPISSITDGPSRSTSKTRMMFHSSTLACCVISPGMDDAPMQERFTVPRVALEISNASEMIKERPVCDKPTASLVA